MCPCAYVDVYGFVCVCVGVSLQCLGLASPPPLPLQALVEAAELLQEAWVGADVSVRPDGDHRLLQPQALNNHQEGQHQCSRAAHTHQTVDKHPSWDRDICCYLQHQICSKMATLLGTTIKSNTTALLWCD